MISRVPQVAALANYTNRGNGDEASKHQDLLLIGDLPENLVNSSEFGDDYNICHGSQKVIFGYDIAFTI